MNYALTFALVVGIGVIIIWLIIRCSETPEQKIIRKLKIHLDKFVTRLYAQYPLDPDVTRLYQRYQQTKVFESNNHETYTLNKGEQIVMCLRDYSNQHKLHDDFNLLIFVGLHELAHVMCTSVDHTPEFWKHFKFILRNASEMNMYDPVDYALDPVAYCAMIVYDNPYFYERTIQEFISQIQTILM